MAELFDLCIVGGGIQGAGIARDAALRGLKVLLCESSDYGAATSSNSSKLIHGGLRYLERLELGLVYESLHERRYLLETAPLHVRPLPFMIPFYKNQRRPGWQYRIGLIIYDLLAGRSLLPKHRILSAAAAKKQCPWLNDKELAGGALYYDCQMDDSRLVLANILDATKHGAICLNHTKIKGLEPSADSQHYIISTQSTSEPAQQKQYTARFIVNTAGPWVDRLLTLLPATSQHPLIKHAKGVHLLLQTPFQQNTALLLETRDAERIFFALPWGEYLLVGTTDTEYRGNLHDTAPDIDVDKADLDYLWTNLCRYLPADTAEQCRLIATYAGVRPLTFEKNKSSRDISRDYQLYESAPNVFSVVGGKYTVYRRIAEKLLDKIDRRLQRQQPCLTRRSRLPGSECADWQKFVADTVHKLTTFLPNASAQHLVDTYGTEVTKITSLIQQQPDLAEPLAPGLRPLAAEVVHAIRHEQATTLEDFLVRRTRLYHSNDGGLAALPKIIELFAAEMKLPKEHFVVQAAVYRQKVAARQELFAKSGFASLKWSVV